MRFSNLFLSILIILLIGSGLGRASYSSAPLKCYYPPTIELAGNSKAVFSGRVIDIKKIGDYEEIRIRVIKSWKYVRSNEVVVFNFPGIEAPHYDVGESYLVFAEGNMTNDKLATGQCSRVLGIKYAQKEVRQLDRWWRRNKPRRR
jgi:hypothetical protein